MKRDQCAALLSGIEWPLSSWFAGASALARFRDRWLGRAPVVLPPRDGAWRSVAPDFETLRDFVASGLSFQVVAERRYDRSADPRRLGRALARGETVYVPQVHQVLPRLMRLMVAIRAALMGPLREERSFLFIAEGKGREGMGLHHDGRVDSFWLQLEGRRTVTIGPPVPPGTAQDLDHGLIGSRREGWVTSDLQAGTLFYIPARIPHRVVYHGRSLALSLTWQALEPRRARQLRDRMAAGGGPAPSEVTSLTDWDVVSGRADPIPPRSRQRLFTQVPAVAGPLSRGGRQFPLWIAGGETLWLPAAALPLARHLATMPTWPSSAARGGPEWLALLIERGVLARRDLPLRIVPSEPSALDGWRFA